MGNSVGCGSELLGQCRFFQQLWTQRTLAFLIEEKKLCSPFASTKEGRPDVNHVIQNGAALRTLRRKSFDPQQNTNTVTYTRRAPTCGSRHGGHHPLELALASQLQYDHALT